MGNKFVCFVDQRVKLSTIKKYEPVVSNTGKYGIKVFFSFGQKPQYDTIYFEDAEKQVNALERLDREFGIA